MRVSSVEQCTLQRFTRESKRRQPFARVIRVMMMRRRVMMCRIVRRSADTVYEPQQDQRQNHLLRKQV